MMVKQNLTLLNDNLNVIIKKMPRILDFDNKKLFFRAELKKLRSHSSHYHPISFRNLFIIYEINYF